MVTGDTLLTVSLRWISAVSFPGKEREGVSAASYRSWVKIRLSGGAILAISPQMEAYLQYVTLVLFELAIQA